MDIEKLKIFLCAAQTNSLSRAAFLLGAEQSTVSRQISGLEQSLGNRLFHRSGRGVTLTETGKRLLPQAQALLRHMKEVADEMAGLAGSPTGLVRLGVLSSLTQPLVNRLITLARKQAPSVRLRVFECTSGVIDEWLMNGHVDIAVTSRYGTRLNANEELLGSAATCLVGTAGEKAVSAPTIAFRDLASLPLVLPGTPSGLRAMLDRTAQAQKMNIHVALEVESLNLQKSTLSLGGLLTLLPASSVAAEIGRGELKASLVVEPRIVRKITIATSTHNPSTMASRTLAQLIRTIFESSDREEELATTTRVAR